MGRNPTGGILDIDIGTVQNFDISDSEWPSKPFVKNHTILYNIPSAQRIR